MRYIIPILILFSFSSCHTLKTVSHSTVDSSKVDSLQTVITRLIESKKDSNQTNVTKEKETTTETFTSDTAVKTTEKRLKFLIGKGVAVDTVLNDGELELRIYTDNQGNTHVDADVEAITIIVQNLRRVNKTITEKNDSTSFRLVQVSKENDSLRAVIANSKVSHTEVVVKEKQLSWWGKLFVGFRTFILAIAVAIVVIIIWWLKRKFG